jgi:aminoglycoside phosphotransferase (APT) family kinase protein
VDVRQIWGGISGARVGRLSVGEGPAFIWKEGAERKIDEEVREIEEWNRIAPGLAPDLKGRLVRDGRESFVREYLDGILLRDVYVTRPWSEKARVTQRLLETVRDVWLATARREAPRVDYGRQIEDRLAELYALHPRLRNLRGSETRVFGIDHRSLASLLGRAVEVEAQVAPPVSVRIHGDFNTNNVIYDAHLDRVRFIDVHRSGLGDYLQDVGVFLVSNLRNPLGDTGLIADLERINRLVVEFAEEFGRLVGDEHFQTRLLLSQARSLITSARVVTDTELARSLYLRGVRLLEKSVGAVA